MTTTPVDQKEKQTAEHIKSLQRALGVLQSRIRHLEIQNRSLDALVHRTTNEALRAMQAALKANNEIAQIHNMLSRRG